MLLFCLIAFGLAGIAANYIVGKRTYVILLLSAGCIALISPASFVFCFFLAILNFLLLKYVSGNKILFAVSILLNVFTLFAFHWYENFQKESTFTNIPVLLGVSFLTLQFIDYICKVYFKMCAAPEKFIRYTTAVLYLPKFFSGPVASLPDIELGVASIEKNNNAAYGLNRILLGLFKKLVLAESLSPIIHSVFDFNDAYPGLTIITAAFLYTLQLYFDFSGYSDIAIGVSACWGITLPENFNFPFRQKNWSDFWKSWHSSLTNWLWQYVFYTIYLTFTRKKTNKVITYLVCAALVFCCMAFFNGIRAGFFISAAVFAFFYLLELLFKTKKSFLSGVLVFIFFSIGLIYFRNLEYSHYAFLTDKLFDTANFIPAEWLRLYFAPLASGGTQHDYFNLSVTISLCLLFLLFERKIYDTFSQNKINYPMWFIIILLLFTWGVFASGERFIYMQF